MELVMIQCARYFPFLHSVEFYVIMTVVAAGLLAICLRPAERGAVITRTVTGWICEGDPEARRDNPRLEIECLPNGNVIVRRTDVTGVGDTGEITLQVTQKGFDLEISEHLVAGRRSPSTPPVQDAVFIFNFMGPEYYHLRWNNHIGDRFAAFTLHVRPGIKSSVDLRQ